MLSSIRNFKNFDKCLDSKKSVQECTAATLSDLLDSTNTDGYDIDYEGIGEISVMGISLVVTLCHLKQMRKDKGKDTVLTFTPISSDTTNQQGDNIGEDMKGNLLDIYSKLLKEITDLSKLKDEENPNVFKTYKKLTTVNGPPKNTSTSGWVTTSLLYDDCPFDYVVPMLYNGGQYTYNADAGNWDGSNQFS